MESTLTTLPFYKWSQKRNRPIDVPKTRPLPKLPKGGIPRHGLGFQMNEFVRLNTDIERFGYDKNRAHVYRIVEIKREPESWFYDYGLMNLKTPGYPDKTYRETELELVGHYESNEIKYGTGGWGWWGDEGSSKDNDEWDAKTLVGRDDGTLRGKDN